MRPFDIYDQFNVELRKEIPRTFRKSSVILMKCMIIIFNKARNRFWKQHTLNREPLNPVLKLAATLCHLDSGANYSDMQYSRRVAKKTQLSL